VSAPSAVFFVHDLRKPILCEVGEARSLVKVGDEIDDEFTWSFDPGPGFSLEDDGELSWTHDATGAVWSVAVSQPVTPHEAYGIVLKQRQLIRSASHCKFWRLESSRRNMELLQAIAPREGMILQQGESLLLALSIPDEVASGERLEAYCTRNEVPCEILDDDERRKVISQIEEIPQVGSKMVSHLRELESPVDLTERFVSMHAMRKLSAKLPHLLKLLTYKFEYEARRGFDALMGEDNATLGSEEIVGRLFDFYTIRGDHMLDIGLSNDEGLLLYLRRRVTTVDRASTIATELLGELQTIEAELKSLGQ